MKKIIASVIIIFAFLQAFSQTSRSETEAYYLLGFSQMAHWNEDVGDININVLGNSMLAENINLLSKGRTFAGRKVQAHLVSDSVSLYQCQILFISKNSSQNVSVLTANAPSDVIVISDNNPAADIYFYYKKTSSTDSTLVYGINKDALKSKDVKFTYDFYGFAEVVK